MLCPVPNPEPQKKENKENSANDAVLLLLPFPFNFKPTEIILKVLSYLWPVFRYSLLLLLLLVIVDSILGQYLSRLCFTSRRMNLLKIITYNKLKLKCNV